MKNLVDYVEKYRFKYSLFTKFIINAIYFNYIYILLVNYKYYSAYQGNLIRYLATAQKITFTEWGTGQAILTACTVS